MPQESSPLLAVVFLLVALALAGLVSWGARRAVAQTARQREEQLERLRRQHQWDRLRHQYGSRGKRSGGDIA